MKYILCFYTHIAVVFGFKWLISLMNMFNISICWWWVKCLILFSILDYLDFSTSWSEVYLVEFSIFNVGTKILPALYLTPIKVPYGALCTRELSTNAANQESAPLVPHAPNGRTYDISYWVPTLYNFVLLSSIMYKLLQNVPLLNSKPLKITNPSSPEIQLSRTQIIVHNHNIYSYRASQPDQKSITTNHGAQ